MQVTHPSSVLAGAVFPRRTAVTVALMFGFALLTAAAAQVAIPLPFTPVPITGQTFAVLLAGAALGSWAGAGSQLIYLAMGGLGLPFFAEGTSGWSVFSGATGGYLVGFLVAAWVVGKLAERRQDRSVVPAIGSFFIGNAIIYTFGVAWLWYSVDAFTTLGEALEAGFTPFVVGDVIKIGLAGLLLPAAWFMAGRLRG